jgi:hypothetical protein
MATQLTAAGVGPGFEQMRMEETRRAMERAAKDMVCVLCRLTMHSRACSENISFESRHGVGANGRAAATRRGQQT